MLCFFRHTAITGITSSLSLLEHSDSSKIKDASHAHLIAASALIQSRAADGQLTLAWTKLRWAAPPPFTARGQMPFLVIFLLTALCRDLCQSSDLTYLAHSMRYGF